MPGVRKEHVRGVPFEAILEEHLRDPEVRQAYEELGPEFELIQQIITLRNRRRLTQAQLAERAGTKQPSIARLETRGQVKSLSMLRRLADALDAELVIQLIPCEEKSVRLEKPTRRTRAHARHAAA